MDVKLHYKMSTRDQIISLYKRFYPSLAPAETVVDPSGASTDEKDQDKKAHRISALQLTPPPTPVLSGADATTDTSKMEIDRSPIYPPRLPAEKINELAERFANAIPENKFTIAELQGYLLTRKTQPFEAVNEVEEWMKTVEEEKVRTEGEEKKKAEEEEKAKKEEEGKKAREVAEKPATTSSDALPVAGSGREEKEVMTDAKI